MDKKIQDEYEALFDMFSLDGWKTFQTEVVTSLESIKNTSHLTCQTNEDWQMRRGEIFKLEQIASYETFKRAAFEQLEAELEEY